MSAIKRIWDSNHTELIDAFSFTSVEEPKLGLFCNNKDNQPTCRWQCGAWNPSSADGLRYGRPLWNVGRWWWRHVNPRWIFGRWFGYHLALTFHHCFGFFAKASSMLGFSFSLLTAWGASTAWPRVWTEGNGSNWVWTAWRWREMDGKIGQSGWKEMGANGLWDLLVGMKEWKDGECGREGVGRVWGKKTRRWGAVGMRESGLTAVVLLLGSAFGLFSRYVLEPWEGFGASGCWKLPERDTPTWQCVTLAYVMSVVKFFGFIHTVSYGISTCTLQFALYVLIRPFQLLLCKKKWACQVCWAFCCWMCRCGPYSCRSKCCNSTSWWLARQSNESVCGRGEQIPDGTPESETIPHLERSVQLCFIRVNMA